MVLASTFMGIASDEFVKVFTISIQFGAILSVIYLYFQRFFQTLGFYYKLLVAFLPAAVLGLVFNDQVEMMLESPLVVAISLLLGGIVLLFVDRWFRSETTEELTYRNAFVIGLFQVIAMIPGVSRSAATIIGGLQQKLDRRSAAEFSFFLAVPTMFAATAYSLFIKKWGADGLEQRGYELLLSSSQNISVFVIGNVVAFIVATLAIKGFISYLTRYGFRVFGYYRIALGTVLIILLALGYDLKMI
jgi:undecaprenyl-diphosphatase